MMANAASTSSSASNPVQKKAKVAASPWQNVLKQYLDSPEKHPEAVVTTTDEMVLIHDAFPKAKHHYLALPRSSNPLHSNSEGVAALTKSDQHLLAAFLKTFTQVQQAYPQITFKAGFHAVPSMAHLHMHIISDDMVSPALKNKKHWNSFTTRFFIPLETVVTRIEKDGSIEIDKEEYEQLLKGPLVCHKCQKTIKNIPELKKHLDVHLEKDAQ
ncbi:UNVERIFIED_CONTAM: hypothetical protein HDU68_005110 [Siphonaria sp. JEL0065]|nr:hypothetical protein HDU68_005110 [Siphonaria sp. JEL0065]